METFGACVYGNLGQWPGCFLCYGSCLRSADYVHTNCKCICHNKPTGYGPASSSNAPVSTLPFDFVCPPVTPVGVASAKGL